MFQGRSPAYLQPNANAMSRLQPYAPIWSAAACIALSACGGGGGPDAGGHAPLPADPGQANQPPEISGTPEAAASVGSTWRFQPSASDPDDDPLQYFVLNAPPWTEFDPATGLLEGTPGEGDLGTATDIQVSVTDGRDTVGLPPFSIEVRAGGAPTGSVTLSWTPPTERVDGTPLEGIAGYRILYGRDSGQYDRVDEIDSPGITRYVMENLSPGTWYFAVAVVAADGLESAPSAEVSKQIEL